MILCSKRASTLNIQTFGQLSQHTMGHITNLYENPLYAGIDEESFSDDLSTFASKDSEVKLFSL